MEGDLRMTGAPGGPQPGTTAPSGPLAAAPAAASAGPLRRVPYAAGLSEHPASRRRLVWTPVRAPAAARELAPPGVLVLPAVPSDPLELLDREYHRLQSQEGVEFVHRLRRFYEFLTAAHGGGGRAHAVAGAG